MFRTALLLLLACAPLRAHSGHESEIALSVRADQLVVVLRCDPELAWSFLETRPPRGPLEAAFAEAAPRFREIAPALLVLRDGESELEAQAVKVALQPDRQLAFTFHFAALDGPRQLRAAFLKPSDHLHPVSVRLYDRRSFRRDAEPVATLELLKPEQIVLFTADSAKPIDP